MFLNIITFLLTTYIYYNSLLPKLSYDILSDSSKYESYMKKKYISLAIYFLAIIIVQFFINTYAISNNCGGLLSENLSAAAVLTLLPWSLIFGVVIMILTVFPGFKGVFSDVLGYYSVAKEANLLLIDLLLNQKVENALNKHTNDDDDGSSSTSADLHGKSRKGSASSENTASTAPLTANDNATATATTAANTATTATTAANTATTAIPSSNETELTGGIKKGGSSTSKGEKHRLEEAADAIVKICGNTSILINQIVPSNFAKYWNVLNPLMKPIYRNNSPDGIGMREKLFKLTVKRDTIGEAVWFIYTGILIASIVQMKIATAGCQSNLQAMEQNYEQYQQEEQQELAAKANLTQTEYTITN